jgi:hypothetical protein
LFPLLPLLLLISTERNISNKRGEEKQKVYLWLWNTRQ